MSTKHTPGRMTWHTREDGSKAYTIGDFLDASAGHAQGNIEICEDDMQRVAACWNACQGVPTEVLEAGSAGGLPWSVADQIDARVAGHELLRTICALLAASQGLDEAYCRAGRPLSRDERHEDRKRLIAVRDAIAKARAAYKAAGGDTVDEL